MGVLFISHSSQDNDQAIKVRDWLRSNGWGEVFLDLDPAHGLAPGQRWQEELKRAGENCAAVVVLVSPNWVASRWCQTEFLVADQLGKRIFPVFIAPTSFDDLPLELKAKFQLADISTPEKETEGFQRLAMGLKRAGLDPKSFDWPPANEPARSVYRGLQALDVQDAAIFFGRDAHITQGLDELRRLRDGAPKRIMVILGASGAGKSSFLRAGLIARLKRDEENFLVLPIVRPERAAITGPQGLNASLSQALGKSVTLSRADDLAQAFAQARAPVLERLQRQAEAASDAYQAKPPTIVLPLDQGEELFGAENAERASFCSMLAAALAKDGNALVIVTIRSDSYEPLQIEPHLAGAGQNLLNLPPIAAGSFQEIIEGPARLAKPPLSVEPALTQQLLADLNAADALPLLAFTLERLQSQYGTDGKLTLTDYRDRLGGLSGAIQSAVNAVLGAQPSKNELALVRRLFVPSLVQVDQDGVKRRVARRQDLPADAQTLVDRFVTQRLLVTDQGSIEVAHEAILRQWPALAAWIDAERDDLVLRDRIEGYAALWGATKKNKHQRLVTRGRPLSEARDFLRRKPQWMSPFARSFVHKSIAAARRGSITLTLIGALLVGATAIGGQQVYQAQQNQHALQTQMLRTDVNGSVRAVAVSPGEYSADNAGYAQSLTDALASPNMSLVDALFEAHRVVFERMQGAQRPILTTDLNGPAFLHARNEHRRIYALIVSCSDYEAEELPDLERPEQDAEILEEFLLRAGVLRDRVRRLRNPTRSALMEEIVRLEQRMSEERPHQRADLPTWDRREVIQAEQKGLRITAPADRSLLLVYYAGQGVSIDGEDMLVPTDARFNAGTNDNESSLALRSLAVRAQLVAATELENSFAHAAAVRVFIYDTQFMSPWSSDR